METQQHVEKAASGELLLDPFSFFVGVASRISGLGGSDVSPDPSYAFHTQYVEAASGRAHFWLRFENLSARQGTLQLWVHMLPLEPGARARVVNSERIQINRLVQQGGRHAIPFESFHGVSFALHGAVVDNTDAHADALVVALDRPADPNEVTVAVEARASSYGLEQTKPVSHLISLARPSLAEPVCQAAGAAQIGEAAAITMLDRMGLAKEEALYRWRYAYVANALRCYGMLVPGAVGAGFEAAAGPLSAALQKCGPEITRVPTADSAEGVALVDPRQIPSDLVNFDFLWSVGVDGQLGSPRETIAFVEASMRCLRPGGLAIHILSFDPDGDRFAWPEGRGPFTRNEIERLAITMISRGHQVAHIRIGVKDVLRAPYPAPSNWEGQMLSEFGVVIRKAPLPF